MASALAALAALLLAVFAFNATVDPYGGLGTGLLPTAVTDDAATKVRLLEALQEAPDIVVVGSSRSLKADRRVIERSTGLTAFNAGVRGGTTVEAYALSRFVNDRFPDARPRFMWLLDVESFRWANLDSTLLNTEQLARYIPRRQRLEGRLAAIGPLLSWGGLRDSLHVVRAEITGDERKESRQRKRRTRYMRGDGYLTFDLYSRAHETGLYRNIYRDDGFPSLERRPVHYLERAVEAMTSRGVEPIIVLTPIEPRLLDQLRDMGWDERHRDLLAELRRIQRKHPFDLVDMSLTSSFGGDPDGFYDGVDMKPETMDLMIETVLRREGLARCCSIATSSCSSSCPSCWWAGGRCGRRCSASVS